MQTLSKRKLRHFIKYAWHVLEPDVDLEWHWHIESVADHVQWMLEQWMKRRSHVADNMVINVPPGSMKSLITNVFAPAWMWLPTNAPHWSPLCISGADSIATRDAGKMRDLIRSNWYVENFLRRPNGELHWSLRTDSNSEKSFKNTRNGWRKSQTQSAKITGDRFDTIILDDPNDIKDISAVKLKHVERTWFAAGNRLKDMRRACRIVIQQRTHEQDLTGVILEQGGKTEHLCIPMEYSEAKCACGKIGCDTTLGKADPRKEGDVLHPERNTTEVMIAEKLRLGPLGVAGQFQQRPSPLEGGMFKRKFWGVYDDLPTAKIVGSTLDTLILSCDLQFKKAGSSRTCLMVIGGKGAVRYVDHVVAEKMDITETVAAIREIYEKYTIDGRAMIREILIEDKANGPAVMTTLSGELPGMITVNPAADKVSRANAIHPAAAAGNVLLKRDAPWMEEFKHELGVFPNGKYDDIVDALTQALDHMSDSVGLHATRAACVI